MRAVDQPGPTAPDLTPDLIDAVDAHPLALDVLRGRLALLGLDAVRARLHDPCFLCPVAPVPGDPAAALVAHFDGWWAAQPEAARSLVAALASWVGPAPLDAIEAVHAAPQGQTVSALQTVQAAGQVLAGPDGLRLHRALRAYVRSRTLAPPAFAARRRAWLGARAADWADAWVEHDDATAATHVRAVEADLRALATQADHPEAAAAALCALTAIDERGPRGEAYAQALARFDAAGLSPAAQDRLLVQRARAFRLAGEAERAGASLASAQAQTPAGAVAYALEAGVIAIHRRAFAVAEAQLAAALDGARALGDARREIRALHYRSNLRYWQGRLPEALTLERATQQLARRLGLGRLARRATINRALLEGQVGHYAEAKASSAEALALCRAAGEQDWAAAALNNLGVLAVRTGALVEAQAHFGEARGIYFALRQWESAAYAALNVAEVAVGNGDLSAAAAALDEVHTLNEPVPDAPADLPQALDNPLIRAAWALNAGRLAQARGEVEAALAHWRAGLGAVRDDTPSQVRLELWLAQAWLRADPALFARAADEAEALSRPGWQRAVALMAQLGPPAALGAALAPDAHPDPTTHEGVRQAARAVWARYDRAARRATWAAAVDAEGVALLVDSGAHAVRPPGGAWVDLSSRPLLWRLLGWLVARHEAQAGPAPLDAVVEALWPGEFIQPEAAANRVYNAVALLRRRGLGSVIHKGPAGYAVTVAEVARVPSLDDACAMAQALRAG